MFIDTVLAHNVILAASFEGHYGTPKIWFQRTLDNRHLIEKELGHGRPRHGFSLSRDRKVRVSRLRSIVVNPVSRESESSSNRNPSEKKSPLEIKGSSWFSRHVE
jgi:hypothetical protein